MDRNSQNLEMQEFKNLSRCASIVNGEEIKRGREREREGVGESKRERGRERERERDKGV